MKQVLKLLILFLSSAINNLHAEKPAGNQPIQSQSSYENAFKSTTTAPPYVLITIINQNTGESVTGCTTENLLLGAIMKEYNLAGNVVADATQIALSNKTHVFSFSKQSALDNIHIRYTQAQLDQVRSLLAPMSKDELTAAFVRMGKRPAFYSSKENWDAYAAYRDATACVLIERGLSPYLGDRDGNVWVTSDGSNHDDKIMELLKTQVKNKD